VIATLPGSHHQSTKDFRAAREPADRLQEPFAALTLGAKESRSNERRHTFIREGLGGGPHLHYRKENVPGRNFLRSASWDKYGFYRFGILLSFPLMNTGCARDR